MRKIGLVSALGIAGALASMSTASFASDTTNIVQAPPAAASAAPAPAQPGVVEAQGAEQPVTTRPNVPLITTGLLTFGLSYVPAVVVAGESSQNADHNLYIPVAGPWIDMFNRPACGAGGPDCTTETTNKVLIGVDGVFQGVGAVMTVLGLLTPETHTATAAQIDKPTIHVSPTSVGTGYGLGAVGTW